MYYREDQEQLSMEEFFLMPEVGRVALTGVGLYFPVTMRISSFTMLIAQGGAPRAAIAMGEGNHDRAEEIIPRKKHSGLLFHVFGRIAAVLISLVFNLSFAFDMHRSILYCLV